MSPKREAGSSVIVLAIALVSTPLHAAAASAGEQAHPCSNGSLEG